MSPHTRAQCLTPPGNGAIATVSLTGPNAWAIASRLFQPASTRPLPEKPSVSDTWFGRIGGAAGDEVIVAVLALEPEITLEIHCHGGRQVVRWLIDLFLREGCVENTPRERASIDPWDLLPHARTLRTAAILLDQANGAFRGAVAEIEQALNAGHHAAAEAILEGLAGYAAVGRRLIEPFRAVIAGAPNAGKSSLLNSLAGFQRSIVAPIPGTTRDIVTAALAFDGWLVELSDTAGLREGGDRLEREGIARARRQIQDAELCLWVLDTTAPAPSSIAEFAAAASIPSDKIVVVLNKVDLPPAWDSIRYPEGVRVSSLTGAGLAGLVERLVSRLVPHAPPPGAAVPYTAEICERVETLLDLARSDRHDELLANFRAWRNQD